MEVNTGLSQNEVDNEELFPVICMAFNSMKLFVYNILLHISSSVLELRATLILFQEQATKKTA